MTHEKKLGEILVENGLVTQEQLDEIVAHQSVHPEQPLGQICIDRRLVSREEMQTLLRTYQKRLPLGEMLLQSGDIDPEQLEAAKQIQDSRGLRLGDALTQMDAIDDVRLCEVLARQFNLPVVSLETLTPPARVRGLINPSYAAQHQVVPISLLGSRLTIALADPNLLHCANELSAVTGLPVDVVLSPRSHIYSFYRKLYGKEPSKELARGTRTERLGLEQEGPSTGEVDDVGNADDPWAEPEGAESASLLGQAESGIEVLETDVAPQLRDFENVRTAEDSPVVQILVQTVISRALALGASDIHLERGPNGAGLRLRIDGVLHRYRLDDLDAPFQGNYRSVVARFKILAQMDITEKRRPQDGSYRMLIRRNGKLSNVDFRISTVPGRFGEGMVIRLLDQRRAPRSLESLGMTSRVRRTFVQSLSRPSGILLVTGPTGSGKSSTLYAALRTLASPKLKILTAEDPIEYTHPGIFQTEVNADIGNSFARYLRSFLRQDPDVIMVGEIRDSETAEMALRAAQTGHLLLSTLHSIDSTSTIQRLLDLEMEPNSIASSLNAVLAQRLIRRTCSACVESYTPTEEVLAEWFPSSPPSIDWKRGRGCPRCNQTRYSGRDAITEFWIPTPEEQILINKRTESEALREVALDHTTSLAEDALLKSMRGVTTLEEAMRVVPFEDIRRTRERGPSRVLAEFRGNETATEAA
ncbi:MAG: Flp pilus assembly complex ATPase component TadA [Candidatus Eisenbacteria bacterium]|uniref:Flp pilus assembly complex ATPase component TadA n=1 Tax=Eiseniibacteriota bacterium TaxID=2212470 RepID=A0A956SDU5_UNCEI|nr:Flp pilus assembly complex ATPase component TadA [Candidatus Eisenbacteria bacterium]